MIHRIKEIIQQSGLSNADFSDRIGVQKSSLSHVLSERNKPSLDFVLKILEAFPAIDSDWLLFGKSSSTGSDSRINSAHDISTQPIVDVNLNSIHLKESDFPPVISTKEKSQQTSNVAKIVIFYSDGSFEFYHHNASLL